MSSLQNKKVPTLLGQQDIDGCYISVRTSRLGICRKSFTFLVMSGMWHSRAVAAI